MIAQADVQQSLILLQQEANLTRTTIRLAGHLLLVLQIRLTKEVTIEALPNHTSRARAVAVEAANPRVLEAAEAEKEETNIGFK